MSVAGVGRVEWADTVKGIVIVLVVLHHSVILAMQNGLADSSFWSNLGDAVTPAPMPLFFFVSGLFAGSAIRRSWPQFWTSRIAVLMWMFVLWNVLRFAYFSLLPMAGRPAENSLAGLLLSPLKPINGLWFLHALVVLLVAAKLLRRVPAPVQIGVMAVVSALFFSYISAGSLSHNGMGRYAVYFLLGLHLKDVVLDRMRRSRPALSLAAVLAYVPAAVAVVALDLAKVPGVMTVLGLHAVVAGILVARILATTSAARPLAYLGANTLPVYVTHVILVAAQIAALQAAGLRLTGLSVTVLPVVLAIGAFAMSLLLARGVRGTRLRFLYEIPPVLLRLVDAQGTRATKGPR